ncbi:membrane-bound transcription factor site-2 protease homolog [Carex rostrata]
MAICRSRRRGGGRPLLPSTISFLPPNYLSLSSSFCYTDFKIYTFNHVLFRLGSAHSRFLKVWFSLGACFGLVALLILSIMLIWNSWGAVSFKGGAFLLDNFFCKQFSPGQSISFLDFVLLVLSTCEGLQIEYIAIFLAVLFPAALVALNQISLENLCPFASLRIYCAGIWHNIVLYLGCALTMLSLPLLLYPLYTHGEGLVVLNVPKYSSLSAHLSPLDLIVTVDGLRVTSTDDWFQILTRNKAGDILMAGNRNGECPQDFSPFQTLSCANSSLVRSDKMESLRNCLIAKDVARLRKCEYTGDYCACSKEEMCMTPVNQDQNPCGLSFVYIGDASFVARSLSLSPYRPRSGLFISLSVYIPYLMEKALHSVFHVSLALAVVNCLPVYLLDGASILETVLCYFTRLTQREKRQSLKVGLLVGTSLSIISCIIILFTLYLVSYSRR